MRNRIPAVLTALSLVLTVNLIHSNPAHAAAAPAVKDWTFLIYLNGHNNLDSYGTTNIKQMEQVGSTDKVNVVVQWASLANGKTERLYIKKSSDATNVTSPVIQSMPAVDMGDYHSLIEFVRWGAAAYPAKHYFIDVWDHGSGWHSITAENTGSRLRPLNIHPLDISWDDNTGHSMTTQQLGLALAESAKIIGHKVDVYGSDACLMAMAEVAGELSSSVQYFVGSQETEPGAGWPYDAILKKWTALPAAQGTDVAKIMVNEYVKSYQNGENGSHEVTFSAFDLSKMDKFAAAIEGLGSRLQSASKDDRSKLITAAKSSQSFTYSDYVDLGDFLDLAEKANINGVGTGIFTDVRSALTEFVIANADTTDYAKAKGVSIWVPSSKYTFDSYSELYGALHFNAITHWGDTMKYLTQDATDDNGITLQ